MFYKIWLRSNSFTSMLTSPGQVARGFQLQSAVSYYPGMALGLSSPWFLFVPWCLTDPYPGPVSRPQCVQTQNTHSCPVRGRGLGPSLSGGLFSPVGIP